jgi:hypothetical protein
MARNLVTVIEISDANVKCLQTRTAGARGVIASLDVRPLRQHTDDELARVIKEMARSKSIEADKLILSIPRRLTILKRLRLPSHQDQELRQMISLQLINQIPYSPDDVTFDYQVVSRSADGYTDALVVIVNKQVSARYLKVIRLAGLSSARMTLSSLGLAHWWSHKSQADKTVSQDPVCLVSVDSAHSEIVFCRQNTLLFSRSVNYGERDLNGEGVPALARQVGLSLRSYRNEAMGPEIRSIILISQIPQAELLKSRMEKDLNILVRRGPALEGWSVTRKLARQAGLAAGGGNVAAACGLGLADFRKAFNLTPPEVHEGKQINRRRREWIMFVLLFAAAFAMGAAVFGVELVFKKQQLSRVKDQARALEPAIREGKKKAALVGAFREKISERVMIARVMDELHRLTPPDVSYRSVYLDERNQLTLQGYAETGTGVNVLHQLLVKTSSFRNVTMEFATKRRVFNVEVTDFKIVARVVPEAKL